MELEIDDLSTSNEWDFVAPEVATLVALLEPLGVDATIDHADLEDIADSVALLGTTEPDGADPTQLDGLVEALAAKARRRMAVLHACSERGLNCSARTLQTVERIIALPGLPRTLAALANVPDEAVRVEAADLQTAKRKLERQLSICSETRASWPVEFEQSALELDLDATIAALRDKGFLWNHKTSDTGRNRALRHATSTSVAHLHKLELAALLEQVRDHREAIAGYHKLMEGAPAWWNWLVDDHRFKIHRHRLEALNWLVDNRQQARLTDRHLRLLESRTWRLVLKSTIKIGIHEAPSRPVPGSSPSLARLAVSLDAQLPTTEHDLDRWLSWTNLNRERLAGISHALDNPAKKHDIFAGLEQIANKVRLPFGPPDTSRSAYREIQIDLQLSIEAALARVDERQHQIESADLLTCATTLSELMGIVRACTKLSPPPQGLLTVAVAGRTKSGKTTLRKALMGDADREGIGRGAHRTTRSTQAFNIGAIKFLDTPGVAAYDDDFDAQTAMRACLNADAVVWNYADTLRTEEADALQTLFVAGKPIVVVHNVKWRVDTIGRLQLFARRPDLAFRDLAGHQDRIEAIAIQIDAKPPLVLPVHSGAAHESLSCGDGELSQLARAASQLPALEEQLQNLLTSQAVPLRALRLADHFRRPLTAVQAVLSQHLDSVEVTLNTMDATARQSEQELLRALNTAASRARRDLAARKHRAQRDLPAISRKLGSSRSDRIWAKFIDDLDLPGILHRLQDDLSHELQMSGRTLGLEWKIENRIQKQRVAIAQRPRAGVLRRIAIGILGAAKGIVRRFSSLRAAAVLIAEDKGNPWAMAAQLAVDAIGGAAKEVNSDINKSRQANHDWSKNTIRAAEAELSRLIAKVSTSLEDAANAAARCIAEHYQRQSAEITALRSDIEALRHAEIRTRAGVADIDLVLARRIVTLAGQDPSKIMAAEREPGASFTIHVRPHARESLAAALAPGIGKLFHERIRVTSGTRGLIRRGRAGTQRETK